MISRLFQLVCAGVMLASGFLVNGIWTPLGQCQISFAVYIIATCLQESRRR